MLALEPDFLVAALPLFEKGEVEALSLSVDFTWMRARPDWAEELVVQYAQAGALFGHAIDYSTLSASAPSNARWLDALRASPRARGVRFLSAHFGLSIAPGWTQGAPL